MGVTFQECLRLKTGVLYDNGGTEGVNMMDPIVVTNYPVRDLSAETDDTETIDTNAARKIINFNFLITLLLLVYCL